MRCVTVLQVKVVGAGKKLNWTSWAHSEHEDIVWPAQSEIDERISQRTLFRVPLSSHQWPWASDHLILYTGSPEWLRLNLSGILEEGVGTGI